MPAVGRVWHAINQPVRLPESDAQHFPKRVSLGTESEQTLKANICYKNTFEMFIITNHSDTLKA